MSLFTGGAFFPVVWRQILMVLLLQTIVYCGDSHRCSSWSLCTCLLFLCVWCRLPDSAENCGGQQSQFIAGRRLPFRAAVTALHGPAFSEDQKDSSVAVRCLVVDALVVHVVQETVWKYRRCSSFADVDVAVISQRQSRLCRKVPQTRSST